MDLSNASLSSPSVNFYENDVTSPSPSLTTSAALRQSAASRSRADQLYTSTLIDQVVTPIWYVVGIVGNMASTRIWLSRRMRRNNSSAIYLAALSINDTLFLVLHVWQELKYAWSMRTVDYPIICETFALVFIVTQYLAPTLVLGFTVERFIAICYPYQKNKYCTASRAVKVVAAMVLVCFLIGSIQPYLWTFDVIRGECTVRVDEVSGQAISLWNVWSWSTEMFIFLIIPLVILAVNLLVMREVWRISATLPHEYGGGSFPTGLSSQAGSLSVVSAPPSSPFDHSHRVNHHHQQQQQQQRNVKHQNQRHTNSAATNVMLLSVSFYVIFTTLPATLVYVLATAFPEGEVEEVLVTQSVSAGSNDGGILTTWASVVPTDSAWGRYVTFVTVRNIINEICLSHYACNFFLFVATGREFRAAVRRTFCCGANMSTDSTHQTGVSTYAGCRQTGGVANHSSLDGPTNQQLCLTNTDEKHGSRMTVV